MEWNNLLKLASPKPRTVAATAVAGVSSSSSSPSSQGNQRLVIRLIFFFCNTTSKAGFTTEATLDKVINLMPCI